MSAPMAMSHFRLLTQFKNIGPYLREALSSPQHYFFDCLAVCISDQPSPEVREFWGWWMTLTLNENTFVAKYAYGRYTKQGCWQEENMPTLAKEEVERTQQEFHAKLQQLLQE